MGKRGVTDDREDGACSPGHLLAAALLLQGASDLEAVAHGHRSAHVDGRLKRGERWQGAERVAADVAQNDGTHALELEERHTVRAAGAQCRRTAGQVCLSGKLAGLLVAGNLKAQGAANDGGRELEGAGQRACPRGRHETHGADGLLVVVTGLLNHVHLVHRAEELGDLACGQRI